MSGERLNDLIERVEKATGPDRELDAAIAVALDGFFVVPPRYESDEVGYGYIDKDDGTRVEPGQDRMMNVRKYTRSIDAALALAERVLPGVWWFISKGRLQITEPLFGCHIIPEGNTDGNTIGEGEAPTLPLAILLATLRALAAKETK